MEDNEQVKGSDVNIKLGADPDELEAAIRTIAYHQGYKHGAWDVVYILVSVMFMLCLVKAVGGFSESK